MANTYKTPSLRGPSSVSQDGAGKRIASADGQRWATSRHQKRALANHRFDVVECWTLKQRIDGRVETVAIQRNEEQARKFVADSDERTEALSKISTRASNMNDRMMQEWGRIERMKSDIDLVLKMPGRTTDFEAGAVMQMALCSAQKAIDNVQTALGEATYPHDPTTRAKYVS